MAQKYTQTQIAAAAQAMTKDQKNLKRSLLRRRAFKSWLASMFKDRALAD